MKKNKAFTLIELLVIIAIIGILTSIVFVNVRDAREKAKIAKARTDIKQIYDAMILLESDTEEWPGHKIPYEIEQNINDNEICADGCAYGLSDCLAGLVCNPDPPDDYIGWEGPYIPAIPLDPWGNEYFLDTDYDISTTSSEIWGVVIGSYGLNGEGLNLYDSDDVIKILISE